MYIYCYNSLCMWPSDEGAEDFINATVFFLHLVSAATFSATFETSIYELGTSSRCTT